MAADLHIELTANDAMATRTVLGTPPEDQATSLISRIVVGWDTAYPLPWRITDPVRLQASR